MRRRGVLIIIIAVVVVGFVGTWTLAYRAGESAGRDKVSTDRSAFGTRVAGAAGQAGGSSPGGAGGAAGTRGPGAGSAVAGGGNTGQGAGGTGASGTPSAGRQSGATSNVTGKVMKVDGATLSVQQSDNSTVSVTTNADTAVRKLVAGALTDLKVGDIVAVDGTKTSDTAFSAKSVTSLGSASGAGGGAGGGRGQGGPPTGASAPAVTGQIKSVSGGTITVQGFDGSSVTVTTTPTTVVRTQQSGTLGDIKAGDVLLIQGDKTSDTAMLARTITNQGATP